MKHIIISIALLAAGPMVAPRHAQAAVADFEGLPVNGSGFLVPGSVTTFATGGATFNHDFTDFGGGCCWSGWAYSQTTDTTTAGFTNQYSAYAGGGADGSQTYGVAFFGTPTITLASPSTATGMSLTNTTYAALSMLNGDSFAKKFGGTSGNDPDFFLLQIIGKDQGGATTGTIDFYLADYRFSDNSQDYIVEDWTSIDLTSLGVISRLEFALSSSDTGAFGINTPAYFALDNLNVTAVPLPPALWMLTSALSALAVTRKRRQSLRT